MMSLITQYWLILEDGRVITRENRQEEFDANGQIPIKVVGYEWQTSDVEKHKVTKLFHNPKWGIPGEPLIDRTGFIMCEPPEIVGERFVVVYNADGSERFRLEPHIDPQKYPAYFHDGRLIGYQFFYDKPHAHFANTEQERVLEFDLNTGAFTGKHWEVR